MGKKIAFLLIGLVVLTISYNIIGQIFHALKSGDRLNQEVEKLKSLEVKNNQLKDQLLQVKSIAFIEQQARDKLGLARDGETVVVIPPDKLKQVLGLSKEKEIEVKLPNWMGWLKLFLN